MKPVRIGIISTARIGTEKVIPAMQRGRFSRGRGDRLARRCRAPGRPPRRSASRRRTAPTRSCWPIREIDAVYNPLPNHLHVPSAIEAAAGRQARAVREADRADRQRRRRSCIEARDRAGVLIEEAFMVRHHPQWRGREIWCAKGGSASCASSRASSATSIPTRTTSATGPEIGGGGAVRHRLLPDRRARGSCSRHEPRRVVACIERDPSFGTTG